LTPVGSSTVHIYTQTVHRTTQLTTLVGRLSGIRTQSGQTNWERVRAFTTEEKSRKDFSQGSRRVPVGTENRIYSTENT